MSEEMAVSDNTTGDEAKVSNDETTTATVGEPEEVAMETPAEPVVPAVEEPPALAEEDPGPGIEPKIEKKVEVKEEPESDYVDVPVETPLADVEIKKEEEFDVKDEIETFDHNIEEDLKRGIKRRASSAFSDVDDEEFKGFDEIKLEVQAENYSRILERLEAEVTAAKRDLVPLRTVMATPPAPGRASKRPRKDTDGSRPSSALSSRSDGDGPTDVPLKKIEFKNQKKFKYTEEALAQAVQAARIKRKGIRESCLDHGVPCTTVEDLLSARAKEQPRRVGPEPILGINGERKVVEWVKELAKRGFSVSKEVLLTSVAILINEIGKENNFPEGRARKKWYLGFLSRHPEINIEPEGISKAKETATDSSMRKWFKGLEDFLTEGGMADIMKDPDRIFNADETRFSVSPKSGKLLVPEGYKNDEKFKRGNKNKTLTVFIAMTASGTVCPPLLVFACNRPSKAILENVPDDWLIGRSESGRMSFAVFYEYIANGFNNWLVQNNVKKPVIVFVDGHKSQKTMSMLSSNFCEENGIIFYASPPNTAHILPPAEVTVLRPLKQDWKNTLRNWHAKPENLNKTVTETNFSKVLKEILDTDISHNIRNGFRNCGIFPFDVNAVDSTKCVDSFQEKWQARSPSSGELTKRDFSTAIRVIVLIKDNLLEKGIDPDAICTEIEMAKSSFKELITEGVNSSTIESRELTSASSALDSSKINIDTPGDGVDNDSLLVELRSIPN